jgi:hypothetical protein
MAIHFVKITIRLVIALAGFFVLLPSHSFGQTSSISATEVKVTPAPGAADCNPYEEYTCLDDYLGEGFWTRLKNYYKLEMGQALPPTDPDGPFSRREDFPPPAQTMPPMPFTEWPYGGTNPLGATIPNSIDSPLMNAISDTEFGKWMFENHIQAYGWVDIGGNISTSKVGHGGNSPAAYDYNPNALDLNQVVLYIDRFPDMVQKEHNDWGFRISGIYGSDYRYTTSYGLGSNQLLNKNLANGWDLPMLYADWYTPFVAQGLNIRVGRYISLPDIEAQLAPNNYMYTHSMTYTYDNYTNTGIMASLAVDKNWIVQFGVADGTEATIPHMYQNQINPYPNNPATGQYNPLYPGNTFRVDPGANPNFTLCGRWNSDDGKSDVNLCANDINRGTYGYNNLQWYGITMYHQIDEHWHIDVELYNEHQNNVPNALNTTVQNVYANNGAPFASQFMPYNAPNLAQCANANMLTCRASATGLTGYLNYSPDPLNNFSLRPEIYWDYQGQRTGVATTYRNLAIGWQHWFSPQIEVRPEIGYYKANHAAFNGNSNLGISPNKNSQTVIAGDIIWHF